MNKMSSLLVAIQALLLPLQTFDHPSSDDPASRSSATSISEVLRDDIWKDAPNTESEFAQDLYGRLVKISQDREPASADTLKTSRRPTVRFGSNRNKSENFAFTFRLPMNNLPQLPPSNSNKRSRTSIPVKAHSPYQAATGSPKAKKRRLLRHATVGDTRYVTGTATFRRALSLRSEAENDQDYSFDPPASFPQIPEHGSIPSISDSELPPDWVPTVPCSPEQDVPTRTPLRRPSIYRDPLHKPSSRSLSKETKKPSRSTAQLKLTRVIPFDVPIIAPPPNHTWNPPLSESAQAKTRLVRFRERERRMREADSAWMQVPSAASLEGRTFIDKGPIRR
ncbi:hypothetical protein BT96DRAFT_723862 [Gymnopus androsaceus JB14]|uniref:Uncharacterized protein n=1 Tax=Gymnopus androsaceus JB14 TaxID=1447944 RepID=A0A6A4HNM0_9AGAR|nr:hypothetical protein BT96DRAFT_723862 [Gymnopus androsaceus JB14]